MSAQGAKISTQATDNISDMTSETDNNSFACGAAALTIANLLAAGVSVVRRKFFT